MWTRWSATDPDRYRFGECAAKWHTFDPDGGRTLGILFWLADQHGWKGWRATGRQDAQGPPIDRWQHPDLNRRQSCLHGVLSAIAKGSEGRRTVWATQEILAQHYGVSRKTITRDMQHLQASGYLRTVGRKIVREAAGGYCLPVYRPVDPELEKWLQLAQDRAQPPERSGPTVHMAGGVWDILAPIPGIRPLPVLVARPGWQAAGLRAPPWRGGSAVLPPAGRAGPIEAGIMDLGYVRNFGRYERAG